MLLWHLIVPPECRALHFIRAFPSIAHGNTLKMQHLTHCWGNIAVHFCNSTQPMLLMATRSKCSWIALFSAMNRNTKIAVTRVFHLDCTQKMQNWTVVRVFHFSKCECTPTMPNVRADAFSAAKAKVLTQSSKPQKSPTIHSDQFKTERHLHLLTFVWVSANVWHFIRSSTGFDKISSTIFVLPNLLLLVSFSIEQNSWLPEEQKSYYQSFPRGLHKPVQELFTENHLLWISSIFPPGQITCLNIM